MLDGLAYRQSDRGIILAEVPSSQMALACVK